MLLLTAVCVGGGRKPFESTHYAWAKDVRKREAELRSLGVDYSPKPIHIAAAPAVVSSTKAGSTSAWNSAGTWEDRDVTTKARQLMEGALGAVVVQLAADSTLRVGNVTRNSGTATLAFVRGQTRPGYEWSVSVEFRIVEGIADADEHAHDTHGRQLAAGTLHLDGISDTESDCFDRLRIEIANSERDASKLRSEISKIATPALRDAIRSWAKALTVA